MVRLPSPSTTGYRSPSIAITTHAQAEYLIRALLATEALLGRARDAEVDQWVRMTRVTLLDLFPEAEARALLRTADAFAHRIDVER